jgi:hypothetical protein
VGNSLGRRRETGNGDQAKWDHHEGHESYEIKNDFLVFVPFVSFVDSRPGFLIGPPSLAR